jgi:hypothetical protein
MHPSSIKVLRIVCKRYSQCLKLPLVRFRFTQGKKQPFLPVLLSCITAEITFDTYEDIEKVMSFLKENTKLRSLKLCLIESYTIDSLRAVAAYIESPHEGLHTLHLSGRYIGEKQLSTVADALQKQESIREFAIHGLGYDDDQACIMRCIVQKNFQRLGWDDSSILMESAKLLVSWLASPNCSLVDLNIQSPFYEKETLVFLEGLKLNRSIRSLKLAKLACDSSLIFDSIAQQGLIEKLSITQGRLTQLTPLLKMLMACKRLEPDEFNIDYEAFSTASPVDYEMLCRYVASPHCFTESINLDPFLQLYGAEEKLLDAWRQNSTLTSLRIDFQGHHIYEKVANLILTHSNTLKSLVIERIDKCSSEGQSAFLKALQSSKRLKTLQIGQNYGHCEVDRSWISTFFRGLASLKHLREFRIWRHSIASAGLSLSYSIPLLHHLRILDLKGCVISEQTLADILRAASNLRDLEELRLNGIQFIEDGNEDTGFDSALKALLKNNPVQVLSMKSVEWYYSTLDMIYNFLNTYPTIYLRIIDFSGCNVDPEMQEMLERLVKSKSGLLTVHF